MSGEGDEVLHAMASEVEVFTEEGAAEMVIGEEVGELLISKATGTKASNGEGVGMRRIVGMGFGEFERCADVGFESNALCCLMCAD